MMCDGSKKSLKTPFSSVFPSSMPYRARADPVKVLRRQHHLISSHYVSPAPSRWSVRCQARPSSAPIIPPTRPILLSLTSNPLHIPTRSYATSPPLPPSFFQRIVNFGQPSTTLPNPRIAFLSSTRSEILSIPQILGAYDNIISLIQSDPVKAVENSQTYIVAHDLLLGMERIQQSPEALPLLRRMYSDTGKVFGYPITPRHNLSMLIALCHSRLIGEAIEFARRHRKVFEDGVNGDKWHRVLYAAYQHDNRYIEEIVQHILRCRKLTVLDLQVLFKDLKERLEMDRDPRWGNEKVEMLLRQVDDSGVEMSRMMECELVRIYLELGHIDAAEEVTTRWTGRERDKDMWNALSDLAVAKDDRQAVLDLARSMKEQGDEVIWRIMAFIIQEKLSSREVDLIRAIEETEAEYGPADSPGIWATLVRYHKSTGRSIDELWSLYTSIKDRQIPMSYHLAHAFIISFCQATPSRTDHALDVYHDLVMAEIPVIGYKRRTMLSDIYLLLLISCCESPQPSKYYSTITSLISDMQSRGITLASDKITYLITILMKLAPDHRSAYRIYSQISKFFLSDIDSDAFEVLITTFLKLSYPGSPFIPPDLFLEMVKDMYRAGYRPGSKIYTSLLKQYGSQVPVINDSLSYQEAESRQNTRNQIFNAISGLHTRIKLDPQVEMDFPLLNALLDAYNRVGAFSSVLDVWEELLGRLSRYPDAPFERSITVILDACGYYGNLHRARKIWAWGRRHGRCNDSKVWETYLECLCRCGQMEEAVELVCGEIKGAPGPRERVGELEGGAEVKEDPGETREKNAMIGKARLEILLKFSWRDVRWFREVQERIRREFPGWWDEVKWIVEKDDGRRGY